MRNERKTVSDNMTERNNERKRRTGERKEKSDRGDGERELDEVVALSERKN